MKIETLTWGTVEIKDEQVYQFENGIPGFEEEKEFAWIEIEDSPFSYLQSLQEPALSFLLTDPFVFYPDYEFELSDQDVENLGGKEDIRISVIVTLKDPMEESTLNLIAPVICSDTTKKAAQIILHNSEYATKHKLQPSDQKEGA